MKPRLSVLVTGAGSLLGQGILRASSLRLRIIAADSSPLSAGLYWADAAHLVPLADGPEYLRSKPVIILRHCEEMVLMPDALLSKDSRSACENGERAGRFDIQRTAGGGIQGRSRAFREHAPAPRMAALHESSAVENV